MSGLEGRKIPCYVLKTRCSITQNYGFLRGNDIQATGPSKPELQDLLYISEGLREDGVSDQEVNCVTEKYAKTLKFRIEEITSLKKLISWKANERENLIAVLKKFESYCTLDANSPGNKSRLTLGLKMQLHKSLFTLIGKVDGQEFAEGSHQVIDGKISLKDFTSRLQNTCDLEKSKAIVSQAANYTPISQLKTSYPGKFDDEVIGDFQGASFSSPSSKNQPKILLEKYVKSVVSDSVSEGSVRSVVVDSIAQVDFKVLNKFDLIVCNLKSGQSTFAESLITLACSTAKTGMSVMLLMPDRKAQIWCLNQLDKSMMSGNQDEIRVEQIFFEKNKLQKSGKDPISENVSFGLIFGKFVIVNPPLNIAHGEIKLCLRKVVSKLLVPASEIAFLSEKNCPMYDLHDVNNLKLCNFTYYGEVGTISSLRKRWSKDKVLDHDDEKVEEDQQSTDGSSDGDEPTESVVSVNVGDEDGHKKVEKLIERGASTSKFT